MGHSASTEHGLRAVSSKSDGRVDEFLRGVGEWAVVLFTLAFLAGGVQLVSGGNQSGAWRIVGWLLMITTGSIAVFTVERWAKFVAVMFLYGTLELSFPPFDGYSAENLRPVTHLEYGLAYLLAIGSAILSVRFARKNYKLNLLDRASLLGALAIIMIAVARQFSQSRVAGHSVNYFRDFLWSFALVLVCLLVAWAYRLIGSRKKRASHP